ncbi:MAG: glycoside hydrolase family 16 protein [Paludibacteraceae bacterium]|nr:glycoside hydrolase family 16 protein [Paludibacteraceae bacterium]
MKKKVLTALAVSLLSVNMFAKQGWQLVWNDEFDYQGAPDESKWSFDTQGNNWDWGNDEAQNYTPKENKNAWVEDGNLVIEARKEPYRWYGDGQTKEYTSARLRTLGKGDWLYGKVEVRALLPKGRGMWPAIWMLASEEKYGGWPNSGELDIMENVGFDPNKIHCNIHTEAYNHKNNTNKGNTVSTSNPNENWHVYSMEWDAEKVIFFLDGNQVFRFDNEHKSYKEWPYDQKFHLLLNVAVGGGWGGEQGIDNSVFPQRMLVDYVRVYQMAEVPEKDAELQLNTSLAETLCLGEKTELEIDTAGTGMPFEPAKLVISVNEKVNGETHPIGDLKSQNGKLYATLAPNADAVYTTVFSYHKGEENEQVITRENTLKVVHPVVASVDFIGEQQVEVVVAEDEWLPFEYVLDNDIFQNDSRFYNLAYGKHTVYVKDAMGCVSDSYEFDVVLKNNTHSEVVSNAPYSVYQSAGALYVQNGVAGTPYRIVSANGATLLSGKLGNGAPINVADFSKGYYLLLLGNQSFPFIVE